MSATLRAAVVADDLTGACDTGVQLARPGQPCSVVVTTPRHDLDSKVVPSTLREHRRLVIDTESRHLNAGAAYGRVRGVAATIRHHSVDLLYKKIDSTLRGQIEAELRGLREVYPDRTIVVAPAYPAAGRTTVDGECLVDGIRVHLTEFGLDARNPVTTSTIADYLPRDTKPRQTTVGLLAGVLDDARTGEAVVVDAVTHDDLVVAAGILARKPQRYLLVGSAGLAGALREVDAFPAPDEDSPATDRGKPPWPPAVLGVMGSLSRRSRNQAEYLQLTREVIRVDVVPQKPVDVDRIARALQAERDVLVATVSPKRTGAAQGNTAENDAADILARRLGDVVRHVVARVPGVRLFLTGGDTALAVFDALEARVIRVHNEIAPGVPVLTVVGEVGGARVEIAAITKAGGFGAETTMDDAFRCLREGRCLQ